LYGEQSIATPAAETTVWSPLQVAPVPVRGVQTPATQVLPVTHSPSSLQLVAHPPVAPLQMYGAQSMPVALSLHDPRPSQIWPTARSSSQKPAPQLTPAA
jgi:hypothetical protein